jgi:ABC-2 type transport system ATP-binding protein
MMNSASGIEIEHLRVVRGDKVAIADLSTTVRRGEITGLLGPSGCGKTTLMRCVVGVQRVTGGTVRVLGEPAGAPSLRRAVGYVTQAPSVYPDLTVAENLDFFAAVLGAAASARSRALATVGLDEVEHRVVGRLSGGQRSRVSLAVALLSDPEVLVLDEPTVGLDPVLRRQLWITFSRLAAAGTTILVSSHVMDEAERCDRLLLMRDGELIADDSPGALLATTETSDIESAFLSLVDAKVAS